MLESPNILIIHADEHRYDCLGACGNPDVRTPHLDALAADGVRYDSAFCPFPVCTPSRYSTLVGLYVHQHLGWTNHSTLPAGLPTFPRVLRDAGYGTRAVGKMHFTPTYLDVGFQEMVLAEQDGAGRYDDDYHRWLQAEGLCDRLDLTDQVLEYRAEAPQAYWEAFGAMESDLDEAHYATTWIGERALEAVEAWEGGGNLLMVGFIKPHHPFDPPAPWSRMYDPACLSLLPGWTGACLPRDLAYSPGYFPHQDLTEASLRRVLAYYYATISQLDHHVGRLVDSLKRRGLYDNTLIVYTGDHGDYMGYHHLLLKGGYLYDPLVRVPLIAKYPGQAHAGEATAALVSGVDLAPTVLRCAGCEVPQEMAGLDLRDVGVGRDAVFAHGPRGEQVMVRTATHKLLLRKDEECSLFFDLERDPFELDNRYGAPAYREEIAGLKERLARWLLFDSPTPVHVDENAAVIRGESVVRAGDAEHRQAEAYFRRRMAEE